MGVVYNLATFPWATIAEDTLGGFVPFEGEHKMLLEQVTPKVSIYRDTILGY